MILLGYYEMDAEWKFGHVYSRRDENREV